MDEAEPILDYIGPGYDTFKKTFTETSLDEMKESVRERLSVSNFALSYVNNGVEIRLEDDGDFDIFRLRARSGVSHAVNVQILSPSHAPPTNVPHAATSSTLVSPGQRRQDPEKGEIPRPGLVEYLYENPQNFFMVQGTAGSGKTTLCGQFYDYLVDKGARVTIINGRQWNGSRPTHFALNASRLRGPPIDSDGSHTRHWVLLDDAQDTFKDPALWAYFKDASWYYTFIYFALSIPRWRGLLMDGCSLNNIQAHQRIELKPTENGLGQPRHIPGLYFVAEEYQELMEYQQKHEELPALAVDLKEWVFEASAGHIGAITSIFDALKSAARRLQLQEMSMATFLGSYRSPEEALIGYSQGEAFSRGFPAETDLQGEDNIHLFNFFENIIQANGPLTFRFSDVPFGAYQAHDRGWLTWKDEGPDWGPNVGVSDFPSLLHRSRLSYQLLGSKPLDPQVEAMTLLDFVDAVLSSFSTNAMVQLARQSQSAGCHSLPLASFPEAPWLNEFRKGVSTVTGGRGVWLSPEFGTGKATGRIDFFVAGSKKWGIELLREGDSLEDHLARFKPGGAYYGWIEGGTMQDYVVLNFGTDAQARAPLPLHSHLCHITFDAQFEHYAVADNMLNVVKSGTLVA
ncbi:hypothetical protein C8R45DRAFT_963930 [Mycena sanguinolenta]|nr:hypothetical protein C8R45DRAFT_963930 [Mycena sanguinolenta]